MNKLYSPIIAHCSKDSKNADDAPVSSIPPAYKSALMNETPRERVARMFTTNELGISPEIRYILKTGTSTAFLAGAVGAINGMKKAKEDYRRRNVAATYESEHLAKRNLTDLMTQTAVKEGFRSAVKYGSFSTIYMLGTMGVANYRNEISVWEHAGCGAILGGFSRINYGVKGFLVAGALGGVLGLIAGGVITLCMHQSGLTLDELRYYQHEDLYAKILRERKKYDEQNSRKEEIN